MHWPLLMEPQVWEVAVRTAACVSGTALLPWGRPLSLPFHGLELLLCGSVTSQRLHLKRGL